jgi:hypothetical protein
MVNSCQDRKSVEHPYGVQVQFGLSANVGQDGIQSLFLAYQI